MNLVESLPTDYYVGFSGARAITSPSGHGVIVQHEEYLYELKHENDKFHWIILPQKLNEGVIDAVFMNLPPDTSCD